ncbi:MAG: hypothetical protein L0Z50_31580 [Verrucomicrobiales bacterium]|nr:hypothetical protein [Verrucomicrobiales bacterium]
MSARKIALVSIGVNLLLIGVVALLLKQPPSPSVILLETNSPVQIWEKRVEVPVPVPEPFDWRKVESEDYRQYIANLRAVGCPEATVRDIIIADVNALFEARRRPLLQPHEEFKFWKADATPIFTGAPAEQIRQRFEQLRLLVEEKQGVLRELLGIDVPERVQAAFAPLNPREQLLTFLSEEKRLKIEELEQRFSAMLMQKVPDSSGNAQLSNYKKLLAEKQAEIARILTPAELEEYELRFSPTAVSLRAGVGSLNPTEHEFREMVRIRKEFDEQFGDFLSFDPHEPGALERKAAAQRQLDHEMSRLLGAKRYTDYQREHDLAFQGAVAATERSGLPAGVANSIYQMKEIAETEVERLRGDVSLSTEEYRTSLDEVRLAVEEAVVKVLGQEGYEAYHKQPGSAWLKNLNREPVTVPARK